MAKKQLLYFQLLLLLSAVACHYKTTSPTKVVADPELLISSFEPFWQYWNGYVFLQNDFIALDTSGNRLGTEQFLKQLSTGSYLPIRYVTNDTIRQYSLFKFDKAAHKNISETIAMYSKHYLATFKMRGLPLPTFQFIDIYGTPYNKQNCQGKIVVLNCWFIHCTACVQEMPHLNKLVERYKAQKDIVFLGLATDTQEQLLDFKKKQLFDYHLVADKEKYMQDSLGVNMYPTQIIVDRNGNIFRILDSDEELKFALNKIYGFP